MDPPVDQIVRQPISYSIVSQLVRQPPSYPVVSQLFRHPVNQSVDPLSAYGSAGYELRIVYSHISAVYYITGCVI